MMRTLLVIELADAEFMPDGWKHSDGVDEAMFNFGIGAPDADGEWVNMNGMGYRVVDIKRISA